ncbi:tetraacyldisaccharide 4'-kinase [Pseudahrensia aquimaris]|uniref:Tetraacyldisaccharide 4'-kinase n=1 Tax=Pseudahrensia aquimaris TaxID=744461 RepID=A0ABW3FF88_9HYPH
MSEAPPFWFTKAGVPAWALSPLGFIYGRVAAKRMTQKASNMADVPVVCVGNFITGGAGKTPTALALGRIVKDMGLKHGFLSRGYGGSVNTPTLVDTEKNNAKDVGDEPLLLAQQAPTVVAADRPAGAALLVEQRVDIIIMDDGFQNPSLHKDFSLAVVDARRGIGNGFCIPAGPVRANLGIQLLASDAVLLIGKAPGAAQVIRKAARAAKPILEAQISIDNPQDFEGRRVLAFSGLADNKKFHISLEQAGAEIVEVRNFHDHHPFSTEECRELLSYASAEKLVLVTTEKDHIRLRRMGGAQELLHTQSHPLRIHLTFDNPRTVEGLLEKMIAQAKAIRRANREKTLA